MEIIDLHCDVLNKLFEAKGRISFRDAKELDANFQRLKKGKLKVQCFAIFIPDDVKTELKFQVALEQIIYFYSEVLGKNKEMRHIKKWSDVFTLKTAEIGAILTLEGVDCIGNDIQKLEILYQLGVLSVGLTWNNSNLAADGIGETRGAGITDFGKQIIESNNRNNVLTDVSHLSERAFWDVIEITDYPIASHSNSKTVCNHPRNLTDNQAKAIFQKKGMVHIVYYPPFVTYKEKATISDLISHIDHFCALGGVNKIGFGSDFDGISLHIEGLEHAGKQQNLINELLKYYSAQDVKGFAYENFINNYPSKLT